MSCFFFTLLLLLVLPLVIRSSFSLVGTVSEVAVKLRLASALSTRSQVS